MSSSTPDHRSLGGSHETASPNPPVSLRPVRDPDHRDDDPGPLPQHLLEVPGFIGEVAAYTMRSAHYPNAVLALVGAIVLMSRLCARILVDQHGTRPNLYVVALAASGTGKNAPRETNTGILCAVGAGSTIADNIASAEGMEDAFRDYGALVLQLDEADKLLRSVNGPRGDSRYENLTAAMLSAYTASASTWTPRIKAGPAQRTLIHNPHFSLFGTAVPQHFMDAVGERQLTCGFLSRCLVVDAGRRGRGQDPAPGTIPDELVEAARYWLDTCKRETLEDGRVVPFEAQVSEPAAARFGDARRSFDDEYEAAECRGDDGAMAIWSRAYEKARKLALLHAASDCPRGTLITGAAAEWGISFAEWEARHTLSMVASHGVGSEFEKQAAGVLRRLQRAPGKTLDHSVLLKRMKMLAFRFDQLIDTLKLRGDIEEVLEHRNGRPHRRYQLLEGRQ